MADKNEKPIEIHRLAGGGAVAEYADGELRPTPQAKQTLAARRREKLIAEDATKRVPFEADPAFFIVTMGRNDRARYYDALKRNGAGELDPALESLGDDEERFKAILLVYGVSDEDGEPAFSFDDVLAYRDNAEDMELLGGLLVAVIHANPVLFPGAQKKIAETATSLTSSQNAISEAPI